MQGNSDIFFITAAITARYIEETTDGRRSRLIARPRLPHSTSAGLISTAGEMHRSQIGSSLLDRSSFPLGVVDDIGSHEPDSQVGKQVYLLDDAALETKRLELHFRHFRQDCRHQQKQKWNSQIR
ncbi:hypothetical protein MUK42_25450 [Musa troglodytarum]|uniref:Uncharacterized protein n=1 Tax=Musa troglodytarum TaxID=320322 RepID=A0A9E7F180_9LILI|nr:hypothetical protein MUK42_25450 [Musa troglodytarum]